VCRSGSFEVRFLSAWTAQRCSIVPGHSSLVAFQMPGAPSAMISAGVRIPRCCRSRPKSSHDS
jgi:hypothetical protein